ncbi:zinc finger protein 346-like [Limulus polyphemus]|uniref:Zinc finger protein 346-like n=1 Tax=Limulus polyphemus TaxID=6850 RepID=A0ABM1C066_LIMPO|nr:zinc finger protein 346-like [Limulus polyphemus]
MFFTCEECSIQCSDIQLYKQHLESEKHRKKQQDFVDRQVLIKAAEEHYSTFQATTVDKMDCSLTGEYFCDTCSKRFSGPVPFKQHMVSENHAKKLKKQHLLSEIQPLFKTENSLRLCSPGACNDIQYNRPTTMFACTICEVRFSGPECAEQHFQSPKHMKTIKKLALEKEVKSFMNVPLEEEADKTVKQDEDTSQFLSNQLGKLNVVETACTRASTLEHLEKQNQEAVVTSSTNDTEDIKSQLKCEVCGIPSFPDIKETLAHYESEDHILLKKIISSPYQNLLLSNQGHFGNPNQFTNIQSSLAKEDTKEHLSYLCNSESNSHEGISKVCDTFDSNPSAPPENIMNNNLKSSYNLNMKADKKLNMYK